MKFSSTDDREFPRKDIHQGVLFKQGMEWFPADIKDVTVGGISFITTEKFDPGMEISVYFGDSNAVGNNELNMEILRSQVLDSYSPPKYLVAAKLMEPNEKFMRDVRSFIEKQSSNSG